MRVIKKEETAKGNKQGLETVEKNPITTYSVHIEGGIMGISLES